MSPSTSSVRAALRAGLIIGALDAIAATLQALAFAKVGPERVWRFVAGGFFGLREALTGGGVMVAAGLAFHFLIAVGWTALFFALVRALRVRLDAASTAAALGGFYGLGVWLAMNLVVIPLSRLPSRPLQLTAASGVMILIHVLVIGVPIALLARRDQLRGR
jgi:hypothetical protein